MNVLRRLWAGIVAAVAGAAIALVVQIVGQMTMGWPIDYIIWVAAAGIGIGFIIGVSLTPRTSAKMIAAESTPSPVFHPGSAAGPDSN